MHTTTPQCEYVALSYLWGQSTSGFDEILPDGVMPRLNHRTVEDAITVTKALDFQYLWVDKYCIPQGTGKESQYHIRQMGLIYKCVEVTIAAAAGTHARSP